MLFALILATISPLFFALVNTFDKYFVEHRVKNILAYVALDGIIILLFSAVFGLFLDWSSVSMGGMIVPIIIGVLAGISNFIFFRFMTSEDISSIIGALYLYPVLVCVLSLVFLGEIIPIVGYIGMLLAITGAVLLTVKTMRRSAGTYLTVFLLVAITATQELLAKISTTQIPELNAVVIVSAMLGLSAAIIGFSMKEVRKSFAKEIRLNYYIPMVPAVVWLLAEITFFFALDGLPVTIVASLGATQPLLVLVVERLVSARRRIAKDTALLPKLIPITLIILGIILLYSAGLG